MVSFSFSAGMRMVTSGSAQSIDGSRSESSGSTESSCASARMATVVIPKAWYRRSRSQSAARAAPRCASPHACGDAQRGAARAALWLRLRRYQAFGMTTVAIRADAQLLSVDPELSLRLPSIDCADPEVTILIPALNEKLTIADFVDWCHQGLKAAGRSGEVLIVDSSNDGTGDIALAHGARVLQAPKRGLGRAYIDR